MLKNLFFNESELITDQRLHDICAKYGVRITPKIRVADVFQIDNSNSRLKSYGLQAHFDFVIWSSKGNPLYAPLFAVEFDGPSHNEKRQSMNDAKKNDLCEQFHLPLLRIDKVYLEKNLGLLDLLGWCIHVWFFQKDFLDAQEKGLIPEDEPFDPMNVIIDPDLPGKFPYWLSRIPRIEMLNLCNKRKCLSSIPSELIGINNNNHYRGIAWMKIYDTVGICVSIKLKANRFPLNREIVSEILCIKIYNRLLEVLNEGKIGDSLEKIENAINQFKNECTVLDSHLIESKPI